MDIQEIKDSQLPYIDVEDTILAFLNSGGRPEAVIKALYSDFRDSGRQVYLLQDLTGDTVPELIISYQGYLDIFRCDAGIYTTALKLQNLIGWSGIFIESAKDMNSNGIPDIVLSTVTCNGPCVEVRILEWDGTKYISLLRDNYFNSFYDVTVMYSGRISVQNMDENENLEMILKGGIPSQLAALLNGFPFREETRIYSWNGLFLAT